MKNDKLDYFNQIKHKLEELIDPSKVNELNKDRLKKVKGKLHEQEIIIFDKIELYLQYILFSKLSLSYAKCQDSSIEKEYILRDCTHQLEDILEDYISNLNEMMFLEFISNMSYWLAKYEAEAVVEAHKEFIRSWISFDIRIEKNSKNKRRGVKTKEKLRSLMGDQIDDISKISVRRIEDFKRFEDGRSDLWVNIDEEIDVSKTVDNSSLILPTKYLGTGIPFRIINEHDKFTEIEGKIYILREYYHTFAKNIIDSDWIRSEDLLKRIVTIYTIKRCQNGDEEAFNILFNLYKDAAQKIEKNFIKNRQNNLEIYNTEGMSLLILASLLRGDKIEDLYESLDKSQYEKKEDQNYFLNKKPYVALDHAYNEMKDMVVKQFYLLVDKFDMFEDLTKNPRNRYKKAKKESTKNHYLVIILNASIKLINDINYANITFMMFNPNDFITLSSEYNKYLFRPNKGNNLTTWLFGAPRTNFKGMIYLNLTNYFDKRNVNKDKIGGGINDYENYKDPDNNMDKYLEIDNSESENF